METESMSGIVFLDVPSEEKEEAESLGAKQEPETEIWYVPAGLDLELFTKWLPEARSAEELWLSISAPIYVAESVITCWTCRCTTLVVALAVEEIEGIFEDEEEDEKGLILLSDMEELPDDIGRLLGPCYPFLKKHNSKPLGLRHVINHCSCGAPLEDFYLQAEPDGGFFPMDEEEAAKIVLRELPVSGPVKIKASFGRFHPDLIGPNARREPFGEDVPPA